MDANKAVCFAQVVVIFLLCLLHIPGTSSELTITIRNSCDETIWPAIVSKPDSPELSKNTTGFSLRPGESKMVSAPDNLTGMLWGRTYCRSDATGKFTCGTGDCGSCAVECPSGSALPAATTVAYFTPNGGVGEYTNSVSLEKGFNLPVTVVPRVKKGGDDSRYCRAVGCVADLNKECPKDVQIVLGNDSNTIIGCNSACEAFKESQDHYCGRSSTYSDHFKRFCPHAQAYQNDKTSNSTSDCAFADYYDVNFCAPSFPLSTPPYRASSPVVNNSEEEQLSGGTSTPLVVKIVASLVGIAGAGVISLLGHFIWSRYQNGEHSCPLCNLNLNCTCCNHFCNCCNSSSDPNPNPDPDHDPHHHHRSIQNKRSNIKSMEKV
ncbi:hypothetical protein TIFTF001_002240 [Ficus carica]|uniref:Thaumatin-like protein n=1 Tax=Ficus carica TaxID=3494 RepID=A0AA87ZLZ2_FICCA|nr:hypothetical protein TIFTF001_002240 [Ficus carica]